MAITMNDYDVDEPYNMEDYLCSSMQVGDVLYMEDYLCSSMQVGDVLYMDRQTHIRWQPGRDF